MNPIVHPVRSPTTILHLCIVNKGCSFQIVQDFGSFGTSTVIALFQSFFDSLNGSLQLR